MWYNGKHFRQRVTLQFVQNVRGLPLHFWNWYLLWFCLFPITWSFLSKHTESITFDLDDIIRGLLMLFLEFVPHLRYATTIYLQMTFRLFFSQSVKLNRIYVFTIAMLITLRTIFCHGSELCVFLRASHAGRLHPHFCNSGK